MGGSSLLLAPPPALSACLFAAVVRDTRGRDLNKRDRFNFFPASPLVAVTHIVEGEVRMASRPWDVAAVADARPLPRTLVIPPQRTPTVSWCAGPSLVVTVGIYPDAWRRMSPRIDVPGQLARAFASADDPTLAWTDFCTAIAPIWQAVRRDEALPRWTGASKLADWTRSLVARAAIEGRGRSLRALERRLIRRTGQNRRTLQFYADVEGLHRLAARSQDASLAALAAEAGYADQSHMGRAVRRATGFSPAQLNRLIQTEEAFWYYRLVGETL